MILKIFNSNNNYSSEKKLRKRTERIFLILTGVLLALSFPPFPFPFQLLMFFAFIPYLTVLEKKNNLLEINKATYLTFFVFSLFTLYWVGSWQKSADVFLMIAGGLLIFVNPVFFLIPSTLYYFASKITSQKIALLVFPFFWIGYEYIYMLGDLSFPWLVLGNGLSKFTSFIQIVDIIGATGLSVLVVYINILLYKALYNRTVNIKKSIFYFSLSFAVFLSILLYGIYKLESSKLNSPELTVGVIQPDIDPWQKWIGNSLDKTVETYLHLSQKAVNKNAKLIIWPETALPVYLLSGSHPNQLNLIRNFIKKSDVYLLTGMPDIKFYKKGDAVPPDAKYSKAGDFYYSNYNGVLLFSPYSDSVQRYGKTKLVPFGENIPFSDMFPFLKNAIKLTVGISGWNKGNKFNLLKIPSENIYGKNISGFDTISINAAVCYESVYPYFISKFINNGADLIVVVTNDSWYGNSSGPYQHKEIAVLRAVENRRTVVRAANGGISTIINPLGETVQETNMFEQTVLVGNVNLENSKTFFTKYSMILPDIALTLAGLTVILFFILKFIGKIKTGIEE